MKILGVDSSSNVAGVAICSDDITIAEYNVNFKKTHSETLLPMIDEVLKTTETELSSLDAIAVTAGPGSFTGLRIGCATVKGLGLATKLPIVAVPTMEAMAYNLSECEELVCAIMDARRSQVFTGTYEFRDAKANGKAIGVVLDQDALPIEELLEKLNALLEGEYAGRKVFFVGDGIPVFKDRIIGALGDKALFTPVHMNRTKGASVAALGLRYFENNEKVYSAADFAPIYLRKSQAEREREEALANKE